MKIVRKIDGNEKETIITQSWDAPGGTAEVIIKNGNGDNSGALFNLKIDGGQVYFKEKTNGGEIEMYGSWERECFIELLKQLVIELELIDKK